MNSEQQIKTAAQGAGQKKNRKIYLDRLQKQGLRCSPRPVRIRGPKEFELALVAATICGGMKGELGVSEASCKALDLWFASGKEVWLRKEAEIACRGLLYFDKYDWRTYVGERVRVLAGSKGEGLVIPFLDGAVKPSLECNRTFAGATRRLGLAIRQAWDTQGWELGCGNMLEALAGNKGHGKRALCRELHDLARYTKALLRDAGTKDGKRFGGLVEGCVVRKVSVEDLERRVLFAWVKEVWVPLACHADQGGIVSRVLALLEAPEKMLEAGAFAGVPEVARFFAVMRQQKVSKRKIRRKPPA